MLTDTLIKSLYAKAKKGEKVSQKADGGGLNFVEGKYWRLSYRFDGKQKKVCLGVYPAVSLLAARKARDEIKVLLAQGIDPSEKKKADKAEAERMALDEALTFRAVAMEYFRRKLKIRQSSIKSRPLPAWRIRSFLSWGTSPYLSSSLPISLPDFEKWKNAGL